MRRASLAVFFSFVFAASFLFNNKLAFADDSVPIHLRIEAPNATLFDADISVTPCKADETSEATTSAYCALEQSGKPVTWSFFDSPSGKLAFLNSYDVYSSDFTNNLYWLWYPNSEYTEDAFNQHILKPGEEILVLYGLNPLKIVTASTTIEQNATTTLEIQGFNYPAYVPLSTSTIEINGLVQDIASSSYDFSTTTVGTYTIKALAPNYAPSNPVVITVTDKATTTDTNNDNNSPNSGGGGGGGQIQTATFDVDKAAQFLASQQRSDGSFGASLYTDWAAIGLAGYSGQNDMKQKLISYLINNPDSSTLPTDSERHAMALMALGINPYSGTQIDYIKKITDSFDGTQIGDPNLYNDDIFALFPLLKAGYTTSDNMIQKITSFIISKQAPDGSWNSIDMTAAAIQALSQVNSLPNVSSAIAKAKQYLKSNQANGGLGNSSATSWTLQAVAALGESPAQWQQGSETPLSYLAKLQQSDGGIEPSTSDANTRIWATAYALPAALGKTWPNILNSFSKPVQTQSSQTSASNSSSAAVSSAIATTSATTTATVPKIIIAKQIVPQVTHQSLKMAKVQEIKQSTSTPATSTESQTAAVINSIPEKSNNWILISGIIALCVGLGGYLIVRKI